MKRILFVVLTLAVVGGGVAALWFFKVPPFGSPGKKYPPVALKSARRRGGDQLASAAPTPATSPATNPGPAVPPALDAAAAATSTPSPAPAVKDASGAVKPKDTAAAPLPVSEADLNRLAGVYEQMPVDEATKIMAKLPDTVVEPLLRRMDERQVGKLLTTFSPERAAKLTLSMAHTSEPAKLP